MSTITSILVPIDFGESSERTLDYARMLARPFQASLLLLHVVPNPCVTMAPEVYVPLPPGFLDDLQAGARRRLNALITAGEPSEVQTQVIVEVGDPLCAIVDYAKGRNIDLIVMGTHGRTGVAHLVLGSVAERVVRTAPCPVLTVR